MGGASIGATLRGPETDEPHRFDTMGFDGIELADAVGLGEINGATHVQRIPAVTDGGAKANPREIQGFRSIWMVVCCHQPKREFEIKVRLKDLVATSG